MGQKQCPTWGGSGRGGRASSRHERHDRPPGTPRERTRRAAAPAALLAVAACGAPGPRPPAPPAVDAALARERVDEWRADVHAFGVSAGIRVPGHPDVLVASGVDGRRPATPMPTTGTFSIA